MSRVPQLPEDPPRGQHSTGPVRHLRRGELARELNMTLAALEKALLRHPEGARPDVQVGPGGKGTTFGWLPERVLALMAWRDSLPAPGGGQRGSGRRERDTEGRARVERILAAEPHLTNAAVAARAGVSESTVVRVKRGVAPQDSSG